MFIFFSSSLVIEVLIHEFMNVFWQHEPASCSVGTLEAELVAEDAAFERAEDALHLAKVRGKEEMLTAATKKFEAFWSFLQLTWNEGLTCCSSKLCFYNI